MGRQVSRTTNKGSVWRMNLKALFIVLCNLIKVSIQLHPSYHGEECIHNGEHTGFECCCDECDYYLACFPDWKDSMDQPIHK